MALHGLLKTQSDARLAELARAGRDGAFEEIVRRYRPVLVRHCRKLLPVGAAADDAVERGLLDAWASLLRGAEVREVRAWLIGAAHRAAVRMLATRAGLPREIADGEVSVPPAEAMRAVAGLPWRQRSALLLAAGGARPEEATRTLRLFDSPGRRAAESFRTAAREAATAMTPLPVAEFALSELL